MVVNVQTECKEEQPENKVCLQSHKSMAAVLLLLHITHSRPFLIMATGVDHGKNIHCSLKETN